MSSSLSSICVPHHIEYLIFDRTLTIVQVSNQIDRFIPPHSPPLIGQDIREHIPELFGCEDIIDDIFQHQKSSFDLKAITRIQENGQLFYLDLYLNPAPINVYPEPCLIIFLEDVTDKMTLEQVLVQNTNETSLLLNALNNSRDYINKIISSMADALLIINHDGTIKTANKITADLLEQSIDQLMGKTIDYIFLEPRLFLDALRELTPQTPSIQHLEVTCITPTGKKRILAFSCSTILSDNPHETYLNHFPEFVCIGRDITNRKRSQQRLATQYAIAHSLSEAETLTEITPDILKIICQTLDWEIGEFWIPAEAKMIETALYYQQQWGSKYENTDYLSSETTYLQRIEGWAEPSFLTSQFIQISQRIVLPEGVGLAGRVWLTCSPIWIEDITLDPDFGLDCFATKVGLKSAFAFPVLGDNQVLGVMTFFCSESQPSDEDLLQMMAATGSQLGQFIKRKEAEFALRKEQEETERLLLNILPREIADRLKEPHQTIADHFDDVTVLFADLVGFTEWSSRLSPIDVVEQLNVIFSRFDKIISDYKLEKIKTIGDAYMLVGGLPRPSPDHTQKIADVALKMQMIIQQFNQEYQQDLNLRIGIHRGAVVAGVIGTSKFIYDLWGDTVNIASRMESHGVPGMIQITPEVYERLKDEYECNQRSPIYIKGKGSMITYFLMGNKHYKLSLEKTHE